MISKIDERRLSSRGLFNESFAASNEREGSEIDRQVIRALLERHIKVLFVTHLYESAHSFLEQNNVLSLRAERKSDGTRMFKLIEGKPLRTGYSPDLYHRVFETITVLEKRKKR